ncbi:MAG: hypothetical protein WAL20_18015 [Rhodomicrobium sp.]
MSNVFQLIDKRFHEKKQTFPKRSSSRSRAEKRKSDRDGPGEGKRIRGSADERVSGPPIYPAAEEAADNEENQDNRDDHDQKEQLLDVQRNSNG